METIKEDGEDEEAEQEEVNKLINNHMIVKTFEELKAGGLNRKATFPRNFSTMSFMGNRGAGRRRTSKESIISSYSRLDFTGSSIQLAIDVSVLCRVSVIFYTKSHGLASGHARSGFVRATKSNETKPELSRRPAQ